MIWDRRAIIGALIIAAVAVWSSGLRAALQSEMRADQESMAAISVAEASAETNRTTTPYPVITPTSPPEEVTQPSTQASPATPSPTGTPIQQPMPTPSPTATPTRRPPSTPSPTASTRSGIPTQSPIPLTTPTIPNTGRFLLVNQDQQLLHVYEDGVEVRAIPVSTGKPVANAFTPAWRGNVGRYWGSGPFLASDLWSDYMWYLFPGARGSILIHSVPYTRAGETKIYDQPDALGVEPVSHGCVRVSPEDAQWLETWDPVGVPIEISPWSGEIGPPDDSL